MRAYEFGKLVAIKTAQLQKTSEGFAGSRQGRPGDPGWGNIQAGKAYKLPDVNPATHYSDGTPRPGVNPPQAAAQPPAPTGGTPARPVSTGPAQPADPPAPAPAPTPAPAPMPSPAPTAASPKAVDPMDPGLDNIMAAGKWLRDRLPPLFSPTSRPSGEQPSMMSRGGVGVGSRPAYVPDMSGTSGNGAVTK